MPDLSVTAIGSDRPGIVAAVTEILLKAGCNLSDCSMSLLRGQFAMILIVEAPSELDADSLQQRLTPVASDLDLVVTTRRVAHVEPADPVRPYVVTVYGADRPGLVHRVSKALATHSVNITDLVSRAAGDVYTMLVDVELPASLEESVLEAELASLSSELGVEVSLRPAESADL